jgi:galactokinase
VFASDLPLAAGMSSSSALVTALLVGLGEVSGLDQDEQFRAQVASASDLATYASCVENGRDFGPLGGDAGVGTQGGSEDHVAMLCASPGALSQFSFCPTVHEGTIRLGEEWTFVVAASGVIAEKTGAARNAYNRAARTTATLLDRWRSLTARADATLGAAVRSAPDAARRLREAVADPRPGEFSPAVLQARLDQFVAESEEIIPAVSALLASGAVREIGPLVDRSQRGAEDGLANQVPATRGLARDARRLGALAASSFGAGFGGSVWALVQAAEADRFVARWAEAYSHSFPALAPAAQFLVTRPGPPAFALEVGYTDGL